MFDACRGDAVDCVDVLLHEAGRRRERWEKVKGKKLEEVYTEKGKRTHPSP